MMLCPAIRLTLGIVTCLAVLAGTWPAARAADAPTAPSPGDLASRLAAGPTTFPSTATMLVNVANGVAGLNAAGQVTAPVAGDASAAAVTAAAPGGTSSVPMRLRSSDRLSVRDYAKDGVIGGGLAGTVMATRADPGASGQNIVDVFIAAPIAGTPQPSPAIGASVSGAGMAPGVRVSGLDAFVGHSLTATTNSTTLTDAHEPLTKGSSGLASALHFAVPPNIPVGAQAAGMGVPANTTVAEIDGNTVYLSSAVSTDVPAGTTITFGFATQGIHLGAGWTGGSQIGFYTQDDYAAFSNAAFWNDPGVGGSGAQIFVPSGTYYLSSIVYTQNDTSFLLGPDVRFLPGSASIDASDGTFPSVSHMSMLGSGHNRSPVELNISQLYTQRTVPDVQGQALLVAQGNVNCINDGGPWGCGMVAEEVKQSMNPSIRRGAMWEYHGTDTQSAGQHISWAGAELEFVNEGGWWSAWLGDNLSGNAIGIHLDNTADTSHPTAAASTVAVEPAGQWHVGLDCGTYILDWCVQHTNGAASNQQPIVDAGIDSRGRLLGSALSVAQQPTGAAISNAAQRVAAIGADGRIGAASLNTASIGNVTSGVTTITIEDGGRFNAPVRLAIGLPPQGGRQATATVVSYALRAVQGAAAINATDHGNAPDGVTAGMTFALPGGSCSVQPQVTYDGSEFIVSAPGVCTTLPSATVPVGMERAQLTLSYLSGGATAPATAPVIEPLYTITSIAITDAGSGYNAAIPPDVFASTTYGTSGWSGIIYTPAHLAAVLGASPAAAPVQFASITPMSGLPGSCSPGQMIFVSDARNAGEGAGAGTGAPAYCTTAGKWFANGSAVQR